MTIIFESNDSGASRTQQNESQLSFSDIFERREPSNDRLPAIESKTASNDTTKITSPERQVLSDLIADGVEDGKISKSVGKSLEKMMGDVSKPNWDRIEKVLADVNKVLEQRNSPYKLDQDFLAAGHSGCHFINLVDTRKKTEDPARIVDTVSKGYGD